MLAWLSVWSEVQMICIWSSWCHSGHNSTCCHQWQRQWIKYKFGGPETQKLGLYCKLKGPLSTCSYHSSCVGPGNARQQFVGAQERRSPYFDHCTEVITTTTTILPPFFRDHPDEPVPEENFCTLWCKDWLTEADTLTIRLGATPSGLTSAHLHHPPPTFFTGRMPFLPPSQECQSTEGNQLISKKYQDEIHCWIYCWSSQHNVELLYLCMCVVVHWIHVHWGPTKPPACFFLNNSANMNQF